ncbi:MAG: CUAEP/CCAEP-tail radical SAM protein [Nitrospirota bacterium]
MNYTTLTRGDILLIGCYELGHPPFSLALLSGFLEHANFPVDTADLAIHAFPKEKIMRAKVIGISVPMHTALRIGVKAALLSREINPNCAIVFFGLYASLNADFLLSDFSDHAPADFVIGGECEEAFVSLIEAILNHTNTAIPGVSQKNVISPPSLRLHSIAPPSRTTLSPLCEYARLEKDGKTYLAGYVEASRGCRHLCQHCPIPPVYEGRFTIIPEEIIQNDIATQVAMGAEHITFGDPDFLNGPNHSMKIVRKMHEKFPHLTFDFTAKIEHVLLYKELLPEFSALGCIFIISAVESLNNTVLDVLKKGHTRTDVISAVKWVHQAGIALRPSLVPFTPWETLDSYLDLFDFVEHYQLIHHIDPVQYTVRLLIPPGSLLISEPRMEPYLGPLVQESFSYRWAHPDTRMDRLQKQISREVEQMTAAHASTQEIFYQLKACVIAMAEGRSVVQVSLAPPAVRVGPPVAAHVPPKMTESWFCCSEPTENQMGKLEVQ